MNFREYLKENKVMTVRDIAKELGEFGNVSDDDVVAYLKKIKADDTLLLIFSFCLFSASRSCCLTCLDE